MKYEVTIISSNVIRVYDGQRMWDIEVESIICPLCKQSIVETIQRGDQFFKVLDDGRVECLSHDNPVFDEDGCFEDIDHDLCGHVIGHLVQGI